MGKPRVSRSGKKTSPRSSIASKTFSPGTKGNIFEILSDEGYAFPFLELPRELRDQVYELLLPDALIDQLVLHGHASSCGRPLEQQMPDLPGRAYDGIQAFLVDQAQGRKCRILHQSTMLLVSKQTNHEFLEAFGRCVPLHIEYEVRDSFIQNFRLHDRPVVSPGSATFGFGSPSVARMLIKSKFREDATGSTPEEFQELILKKASFKDFTNRLLECKRCTHLVLRCRLDMIDQDWMDHEFYEPKDKTIYQHYERSKTVYRYLQSAIESLPNVTRYGIEILLRERGWLDLAQLGYAQRRPGSEWGREGSTNFMFDTCLQYISPASKVWQPEPAWRALYDMMHEYHPIPGHRLYVHDDKCGHETVVTTEESLDEDNVDDEDMGQDGSNDESLAAGVGWQTVSARKKKNWLKWKALPLW